MLGLMQEFPLLVHRLLDHAARLDIAYFGPDRFTGRDTWQADWLNPLDGAVLQRLTLSHNGGPLSLASPAFTQSAALRLTRK